MEYTTGSRIIDDVQPMRDLDVTRSSRDNGVRTFDEVKKKKNSRADKNIRHKKGKTLNNSTITMSAVMLKSSFYLLFRQ